MSGGPAVVAVGGGHGLAVTLRSCVGWAGRLTAVVSVADDGGSSGRIRTATGLPAPGDLRRCLSALADPSRSGLAAAFERRFEGGDLDGHAAGNILLAALAAEAGGDLAAAVRQAGELLGLAEHVAVLPASSDAVTLVGTTATGTVVRGQVAVEETGGVERVHVEPATDTPAAVIDAVAAADLIVLGPGSLYGSVLAAAAVPDLLTAIAKSDGRCAYVANLRVSPPETAGYGVADHVAALRRHGIEPDVVVAQEGVLPGSAVDDVPIVCADVMLPNGRSHDPARLGPVLEDLVRASGIARDLGPRSRDLRP